MADAQAWGQGWQQGAGNASEQGQHKRNRNEQLQDEQRHQKLSVYTDLFHNDRISPAEYAHAVEDVYHDAEPEKKMSILGRALNHKKVKQQAAEAAQGKQTRATDEQGIISGATPTKQLEDEANERRIKLAQATGAARTPPKEYVSPDGKQRQWFKPGDEPDGWNAQQGSPAAETEYQKASIAARKAAQDLNKAKFDAAQDPNNPATKQKLQSAKANKEKADAYMLRAQAAVYGSVNGKPLPGAMVDTEGEPVGSSFQSNVRPTGAQREKATLATSARDQLADARKLLQTRGDLFGPGAGRVQKMATWVGSQDPDAAKFTAAVTTAADHLMGVFGGRSTWAGQRIEDAMGQLKTNPEAAIAAIDQIDKAAALIQGVGSYQTVGGGQPSPKGGKGTPAPKKPAASAKIRVKLKDGRTGTIDASEFDAKTMTKVQ